MERPAKPETASRITVPFASYSPLILKKQISESTETTITILFNSSIPFTRVDRLHPHKAPLWSKLNALKWVWLFS
jgi:hypothetical protein